MDQETAEKILKETEQGYDLIAGKFSETRKYFWRGLEFIGDYVKNGDKVLDFGCGNGRLLELFSDKNIDYFGVDVSEKLIETARKKYLHPVKSSQSEVAEGEFNRASFSKINPLRTTLPFVDNSFNTIFSIAVFHHFPSKKYRENVARELYRVTKKDGRIIITVWNLYQKRYIKNILRNWKNKIFGKSNLDWEDCYISFTDNEVHPVKSAEGGAKQFNGVKKFQRFHHAFTKRELRKLFKKAGFEIEKCETINGRNIVLIGKK